MNPPKTVSLGSQPPSSLDACRIRSLILATMFLIWGVVRIIDSPVGIRWSVPVLGSSLLQFTVAWLFANRSKARAEGDLIDVFIASISLIVGAQLLALMPAGSEAWSKPAIGLIALGSLTTIASLLNLGTSFAIFPARRSLVTSGVYRWIRHPAYAGELIVMLGVATAVASPAAWLLMAAVIGSVAWRIQREEKLLSSDENHAEYCNCVRWRLIPRIW